jgi:uncharacterized glyoxalase superfamily protein PhnB
MKMKKVTPLVTSNQLSELKTFYTQHFGFKVHNDTNEYLGLVSESGAELSFMGQDELAPAAFAGKGLTLCFEVANVDEEANRLNLSEIPVVAPLQNNPWGDRSIILRDPIGIHVYVYQPIAVNNPSA